MRERERESAKSLIHSGLICAFVSISVWLIVYFGELDFIRKK